MERAGRELPDLFNEVLQTALATTADPGHRREQIAILAAMARPARIVTLAKVMGESTENIERLVRDMAPGLKASDGSVGFADEDFDAHVRAVVSVSEVVQAHERFVDYFDSRRHTDSEAAYLLGEHPFNAGRGQQLTDLVIGDGTPAAITDSLLRAQTFRSRVSMALRLIAVNSEVSLSEEMDAPGRMSVVRLVLAAADAARSDSSHMEMVRQSPELAVLHGDPSAVAAILLRDDSSAWRGKLHMRTASLLAITGRREEAAEQLAMAGAWLRARDRDRDSGHQRSRLDAADLAHMAIAMVVVDGIKTALQRITSWPPRALEQIMPEFLSLAPGRVPVAAIIQALRAQTTSAELHARTAAACAAAGQPVPVTWVKQIAIDLDRLPDEHPAKPAPWCVSFCELAAVSGVPGNRIRRLIARFGPDMPNYMSDHDAHARMRPCVEAACIEAATLGNSADSEALVANVPADDTRRDYTERQRTLVSTTCRNLLPVLQARAACLVAVGRHHDIGAAIEHIVAAIRKDLETLTQRAGYHGDSRSDHRRVWFSAATAAVVTALQARARQSIDPASGQTGAAGRDAVGADLDEVLVDLAEAATSVDSAGAPWIWMRMAEVLLPSELASDFAIELLGKAADAFAAEPLPAAEARDLLVEAASMVHRHDPDFAAELFDRAIRAAEGIDADIGARIRTVAHIAAGATGTPIAGIPSRAEIAGALTGAIEEATPFVIDPADYLPHRFVLGIAAQLHGPTGLATGLRWAHEERIALATAIATVLPPMIVNQSINIVNAFWLLRLFGTNADVVAAAAPIVTVAASLPANTGRALAAAQLATLAEWIQRDLLPESRRHAAKALCTLAQNLGLQGLGCIVRIRQLGSDLAALEPPAKRM